MGVAEDHGPAGGAAHVRIGRVLEYLFNLFFRDAMAGSMLDIAIRVVVEIPDDRLEWHRRCSPGMWYYNTTFAG
jgi:hypothetical protein